MAACWVFLSVTASAQEPARRYDINIPATRADAALKLLASQAETQLLFSYDLAKTVQANPVSGRYTLTEALEQLLRGTGLSSSLTKSGVITVTRMSTTARQDTDTDMNSKKNSSILGSIAAFLGFGLVPPQGHAADQSTQLEEVVVTAQKRTENLQDVPVPVSVISATELVKNNQVLIRDFYSSVPGLNVTPAFESTQELTIRGITTGGYGNPTVGVVVDDVPFASSTQIGGGLTIPDLDPGDLERIEVLRGPQGTLYGASSMGGLLKFVTIDPSMDRVSGHMQVGTSGVSNGAELGYNFRGSVNLPLGDTLALRVSGFGRQDPGYIDNPVTGVDGVNEAHAFGGRLSALWRPADSFSLKLSGLYQRIYGDAPSEVDVPNASYPETANLRGLQQNTIPGVGPYDRTVQAYSVTINAKLGVIDLTAISGYNVNKYHDSWDFTWALGSYSKNGIPGTGFNGFGVTGTTELDDNTTDKFTQEVRLSGSINSRLDWLLGGFYTHEHSSYVTPILALDTAGAEVGSWLNSSFPTNYGEYAGFANLTYHFTDRFNVQVGGRLSHIEQTTLPAYTEGPYNLYLSGLPSPYIAPEATATANPVTYLLSPQFKFSSDLMLYARLASGYRAGGTNSPGAPLHQYDPDKTKNYELGVKGAFFDRVLSVDASVYYIDWKNLQFGLSAPNYAYYYGNAGQAKSQGVELSVGVKPLTGLKINAWVAWNEAVLTADLPPAVVAASTYGVDGQRLPFSSRWSGNLSIDQEFPLSNRVTGFVGGDVSYVGSRSGNFQQSATPPPVTYPDYAKVDLRAGAKRDSWTVNVYANNVADKRGVLSGGPSFYPPYAYTYIQPRTVGLNVLKTF
jgi:iron complex outermembrane recepter protein